ncbi:hypothetical protein [Flavobacterium psychrophilum]|uniref:Uncharacterized protein n=1 Tax=Flavobacterium psychrophilum TaxID=96345 RepID=A0A7U2NE52_FLAPS|nr:hypothetical protein [Flavobacterium psychrophilum]QRE03520.1 hypothetical protein H0H26_11610 [Flavobacterium psychrophilum]
MAAITTAAISVGVSGYMAYDASEKKKQAKNEMNDYERQSLDNAFKHVQISTVGTDLMREENQRTTSNLVDASQDAGVRGIMGAIPKIQAQNTDANQEAKASLDNQIIKRDYAIAGDEQELRGLREQRDNSNIAALSSQINKADQDMWNGIGGAMSGMSSMGGAIEDQQLENKGYTPEERAAILKAKSDKKTNKDKSWKVDPAMISTKDDINYYGKM